MLSNFIILFSLQRTKGAQIFRLTYPSHYPLLYYTIKRHGYQLHPELAGGLERTSSIVQHLPLVD